jgi:hypothetical protein
MQENDCNKSNLGESYQPDVAKTYTPKVVRQQTFDSYTPNAVGGSYQPVIPITVSSEQPTPPTSGSGVPTARPETDPNSPAKSSSE